MGVPIAFDHAGAWYIYLLVIEPSFGYVRINQYELIIYNLKNIQRSLRP